MILIAVSMGIAAAFIGWFLSTYYIFTWRPEILRVLDIKMYYNETDGSWYLNMTVVNIGEAPAEIYKLEVYGVETVSFNPPIVVKPSEERVTSQVDERVQTWSDVHNQAIPEVWNTISSTRESCKGVINQSQRSWRDYKV